MACIETSRPDDTEREREFFRYYLANRSATPIIPPYADKSHQSQFGISYDPGPQFVQDPTLVALAQLGALRLKCERALITFFSRTQCYVLAETTTTTGLEELPKGEPQNGLCWGSRITGTGLWVCETTVNLPMMRASEEDHRDVTALVVPDLRGDERFKDRPYVKGPPYARFYAGVPIRSPSGCNIGAFCALDGEPRPEGVTDVELTFLKGLAMTTMRHLELVKSEEHLQSMAKMINGLNDFIQDTGSTSTAESQPASPDPCKPSADLCKRPPISSIGSDYEDSDRKEIDRKFQTAANVLRSAVGAEGLLIYDAKITTFGGLVDRGGAFVESTQDKACSLLGRNFTALDAPAPPVRPMSEQLLKSLLDRYPQGQIFQFASSVWSVAPNLANTRLARDALTLSRLFPSATSGILLPLQAFDRTTIDRPFAAILLYICDGKRLLTEKVELAYTKAFGNSLMAEVARLDTKRAEYAKANFLSGVSHDLRSPLHAVWGAVELLLAGSTDELSEPSMSPWVKNMIQIVGTSGLTLLDTITHILDYSKLTSGGRIAFANDRPINPGHDHSFPQDGALGVYEDVNLATLTEEVVDIMYEGLKYRKRALDTIDSFDVAEHSTQTSGPQVADRVQVVLDISKSDNWVFITQPGAWRRIVMSIFGNALKFTDRGFIHVKLECKSMPPTPTGLGVAMEDTTRIHVVLTVTDTGRGMSTDFQSKHLYQPFAQEFPLEPGAGLGMSIVKRIVDSLGGHINVHSKQGRGTQVAITIGLDLPNRAHRSDDSLAERLAGATVALVGLSSRDDQRSDGLPSTPLASSVRTACERWMRMSIVSADSQPDIIITTNEGLQNALPRSRARTLVLSDSSSGSNAQLRSREDPTGKSSVSGCMIVDLPCGPKKLAKALRACLEADQDLRPHDDGRSLGAPERNRSNEPSATSSVKRLERSISQPDHRAESQHTETTLSCTPNKSLRPILHRAPSSVLPGPTKLNILLVDDSRVNLQLLAAFMKRKKHACVTASDGLQAVNAFKAAAVRFDFILIDISMPVMDGLQATRLIREHEKRLLETAEDHEMTGSGPELQQRPSKIIALTAMSNEAMRQEAFSSGVDAFITKPVRFAELNQILEGPDELRPG